MFLSQIERRQEEFRRRVNTPGRLFLVPSSDLESPVAANADASKQTRTCGVEIPLDVHANLKAEAKARKAPLKVVALEYLLAGFHNHGQVR
jgi:hypothetical protein